MHGQYTLRRVLSPCHHCIIRTVTVHVSGDSIVVALSSSSSYIAVVNINYLSLVALLFHAFVACFFSFSFLYALLCVCECVPDLSFWPLIYLFICLFPS